MWDPVGAKTMSCDLLFEVELTCSMWYSAHKTLGMVCIYSTGGMCYGSVVGLSDVNLESVNLVDRVIQL